MSKEELKDDIINDIDRLLKKEGSGSLNMTELFNENTMSEMQPQQPQVKKQPQMQPQMQPQQMLQQPMPQQMQQMNPMQSMPPMHPQMQPMQPQQMQPQQITPQMLAQMPPHVQQQMFAQMPPQLQHQMLSQMPPQIQQQIISQMSPQMQQQLMGPGYGANQARTQGMLGKEHMAGGSFDINQILYSQRDSLVLLLLYLILLTPQVNSLMNKISHTSDNGYYPNYLGILLRGTIFIGMYIGLKKLNLI